MALPWTLLLNFPFLDDLLILFSLDLILGPVPSMVLLELTVQISEPQPSLQWMLTSNESIWPALQTFRSGWVEWQSVRAWTTNIVPLGASSNSNKNGLPLAISRGVALTITFLQASGIWLFSSLYPSSLPLQCQYQNSFLLGGRTFPKSQH